MKVGYLTGFYNGNIDGRLGRFHDWVHQLRDMSDPPFEHEIHTFTGINIDNTLASEPHSYLGDGNELWGYRRNKFEYLLNIPRVYNDIQRSDCDILHILQLGAIVYSTGILSQDCPIVIGPDIAGWSPVRSGGRWEVSFPNSIKYQSEYWLKRFLSNTNCYDMATAYGRYHREILKSFGIPTRKISTLPAGVDPIFSMDGSSKNNSKQMIHLLYVGDMSEHKGLTVFIDAIKQLQEEVQVTLLGAGDSEGVLTDDLSNIRLEGFVERKHLPEYYKEADLHIMPSIDETAGANTVIESLACGTPVVVTDKTGINEYPPPDASIMFWPRDSESLASAIEDAMTQLPELQTAARSYAQEFHVNRTIDCLDQLYQSVLN